MFKNILEFFIKKISLIQELLDSVIKTSAKKPLFKLNDLNNLMVNFEKDFLQQTNSYKTIKFNNKLDEICKIGDCYYNCNYTFRTSTKPNPKLIFELYNIYENLPLNIVLPVCRIYEDIKKQHFRYIETEKYINIYVEIVVFEDEKDSYFNKVLIAENYSVNNFLLNINLIRNKTVINLLRLLDYYKISKIRLLKIVLI